MFAVEIKRRAVRKLKKPDEKRKSRLRKVILALKEDPVPFRKMDIQTQGLPECIPGKGREPEGSLHSVVEGEEDPHPLHRAKGKGLSLVVCQLGEASSPLAIAQDHGLIATISRPMSTTRMKAPSARMLCANGVMSTNGQESASSEPSWLSLIHI